MFLRAGLALGQEGAAPVLSRTGQWHQATSLVLCPVTRPAQVTSTAPTHRPAVGFRIVAKKLESGDATVHTADFFSLRETFIPLLYVLSRTMFSQPCCSSMALGVLTPGDVPFAQAEPCCCHSGPWVSGLELDVWFGSTVLICVSSCSVPRFLPLGPRLTQWPHLGKLLVPRWGVNTKMEARPQLSLQPVGKRGPQDREEPPN